jgi:SLT domain-containing protein
MPMGLGGGVGSGLSLPGLDSLSSLTGLGRDHHSARAQADEGLTLADSEATGPGPDRERAAIHRALDIKGIRDPVARARWEAGMMMVTKRESTYNSAAENDSDGDPAVGSYQFKLATFRSYHEPGTADDRKDNVAAACAFINYARGRYHVAADASNLAANIQQADPTRPAAPY